MTLALSAYGATLYRLALDRGQAQNQLTGSMRVPAWLAMSNFALLRAPQLSRWSFR
jgi:hypothetical protein